MAAESPVVFSGRVSVLRIAVKVAKAIRDARETGDDVVIIIQKGTRGNDGHDPFRAAE
jgi:hypothetical protein